MQTSQLLGSLLHRTVTAASKQIELSPGQIFRGTVLKLHPDQMATVQIGGLQLNARLETNLEAGQKAWLQVQPTSGVVTLKVMQDTYCAQESQDASFHNLLRALGVTDTPASQRIVQALVKQNLPVNKEVIQAFAQISRELGADESTLDAFLLAMRRNLPLTRDVVQSVKAFLSEQTLTDAIHSFLAEAEHVLQQQGADKVKENRQGPAFANASQQAGAPWKQTLQALQDKLGALALIVETEIAPETESTQQAAKNNLGNTAESQTGQTAGRTGLAKAAELGVNAQKANGPLADLVSQAGGDQRGGQVQVEQEFMSQRNNPIGEQSTLAAATDKMPEATQSNRGQQDAQALKSVVSPDELLAAGERSETAAKETIAAAQQTQTNKADLLKELFWQLGISHEREVAAGIKGDARTQGHLANVKALLLQLTQGETIPSSLRDAAESLLQQVTGQQLMLVQQPNQAIAQVVMQIPFRTPDGNETAYVQIEAKRREGGELDSDNCRLFFNLDMEHLGITMIDVAIVNRIINVQLFNDQPWLEAVVQQAREQFSASLLDTGYHLSSMRVLPLPDDRSTPARPVTESLMTAYKGVDFRV